MRKIALILILVLCVTYAFGKKTAVLQDVLRPEAVATGNNELYVLDDTNVYVYSLDNFKLKTKFGKKGNGPGEFNPQDFIRIILHAYDDEVLLCAGFKMAKFSKAGKLLMEKTTPFFAIQPIPMGNQYAISTFEQSGTGVNNMVVKMFNGKLEQLNTLYAREDIHVQKSQKLDIPNELIFTGVSSDGKLFVFDQKNEFRIDVYDEKGKAVKKIEIPYKKIKVDEKFKKETMAWLKVQPMYRTLPADLKQMLHFHEYLPPMRSFKVNGKRLYVETYKRNGDKCEFYVLDTDGKVLNKVYLTVPDYGKVHVNTNTTHTFVGDKYYYLKEDMDTEKWELYIETIK